MLRLRDLRFNNDVHKSEKLSCRCFVISQVNLTGMDGAVSNNPNDIERLLNSFIQALLHKVAYFVVYILPLLAKINQQLLYAQTQQGSGASGRLVEYLVCFQKI